MSYYLSTVLVYLGVDVLAAWALNIQFGWAGVPNFAFIIFQAIGAYAAGVVSLGPDSGANSFQRYILGANLPFPLPLLVAAAAGGLLALFVGVIATVRLRRDYQAAVFLLIALIASQVVSGDVGLFNGSNGLAAIPQPLSGALSSLSLGQYQWVYAGFTTVVAIAVLLLMRRLGRSGWQRALRASRDDETAAGALGLNVPLMRLQVFVLGGAIAGLSGGLLVGFITAWSPGGWGYAETFAILTGIILGGVGNDWGVLVGTFLVQIVFIEVPSFLPEFGYPGLIDKLEWIVIGFMWLAVLILRPGGIIPERRYRARLGGAGGR
ncbi:MAG TPA: branched-chain amino acid ABC transporter permease [Solirubrobacteraceae bacterium]|nr:branched-chain amino acid ABC transporter permease [Solirubrobacteraceae bacterium]